VHLSGSGVKTVFTRVESPRTSRRDHELLPAREYGPPPRGPVRISGPMKIGKHRNRLFVLDGRHRRIEMSSHVPRACHAKNSPRHVHPALRGGQSSAAYGSPVRSADNFGMTKTACSLLRQGFPFACIVSLEGCPKRLPFFNLLDGFFASHRATRNSAMTAPNFNSPGERRLSGSALVPCIGGGLSSAGTAEKP